MYAIIYPNPAHSPTGWAKVRLHRVCDKTPDGKVSWHIRWLEPSRDFTRDDYEAAHAIGARIVCSVQRDAHITAEALRIHYDEILPERPQVGDLAPGKDKLIENVRARAARGEAKPNYRPAKGQTNGGGFRKLGTSPDES